MHEELAKIVACPTCGNNLSVTVTERRDVAIVEGELRCAACAKRYPVARGIPRVVPSGGYAGSFGFRWSCFKLEQLDSASWTTLSSDRFSSETGWSRVP